MSKFFNVTFNEKIMIDDSKTSRNSTWSSELIIETIMNYINGIKGNCGGNALKYMEINDEVLLEPGQVLKKDYDLKENNLIVTTLYLDIEDGSYFRYKIFDKSNQGFLLYDSYKVQHYTDSIFLPYKDKDDLNSNKLHTEITSFNLNKKTKMNVKILGLEISK